MRVGSKNYFTSFNVMQLTNLVSLLFTQTHEHINNKSKKIDPMFIPDSDRLRLIHHINQMTWMRISSDSM